jgi:hypothetical protein
MHSHRQEAVSVANFRALRNDRVRGLMAAKPTLEAITLLGEFGFEFVAADQVGEPTPGRIADRLSEIIAALEEANARGNPGAVHQATEKLKRLQQAIDVWSLLASQLDDNQPAPQPAPPRPLVQAPASAPPVAPMPIPTAPPVAARPVPTAPPVAVPPPSVAPAQVMPPPAPPQVMAPSVPPAQVTPPPPAPEYPPPPVPDAGSVDIERLELAAAGNQQAFLQTIGQVPARENKK